MNKLKKFQVKIESLFLRQIVGTLFIVFLLGTVAQSALAELTQAQAIARVKTILSNNANACQINKTSSISAVRVKAGWRVTANITMSASGTRTAATAVWIVSAKNGASPQNQLTAEIANGCL